jgi:GNAT superfamily N-acetyltransferase
VIEIRRLNAAEGRRSLEALAAVLIDCVEGGASVSFMTPLSPATAESFFRGILDDVNNGDRILLAAFDGSQLVGTVQIVTATPPNQPHRADVAKLLVARAARRQGIGELLMEQVEREGRQAGKTLLVLDTCAGGSAEKLYLRLGWKPAGVIPRYALYPDGTWCDTVIFWKDLTSRKLPACNWPKNIASRGRSC